jgi:superfamily II DNA/RNA helicase
LHTRLAPFCFGPFLVVDHRVPPPGRSTPDDPASFGDFMAARRSHSTTPTESTTFADLGVPTELTRVLAANGVTTPFPIQAATLPDAMAGRDVLGQGRTGSGKTYAFALPMVVRLTARTAPRRRPGRPRALILAPTRELATQIEAAIAPLAQALSLRTLAVFGGVRPNPQIKALRAGVDILVACPGRLTDHVESGHARLDDVEITVLDEADHMADLGFLPVVRRLLDLTPRAGQRMLFSATLDAAVDVLVRRFLTNPVTHRVDTPPAAVEVMAHHVLHVSRDDRLPVLVDLAAAPGRKLVFTRTKHRARALTRQLVAAGVPAVELHGNLAQNARDRNLLAFSEGSATTLVATDIAARGIHVDEITVVIHADPPVEHKAYLHRSGRTARAGASGTVVTLMTDDQVHDVRALTRKAGVEPTTTRLSPGHPLLTRLAPGRRTFVTPPARTPSGGDQPRQPGRSRQASQPRQSGRTGNGSARTHRSGTPAARSSGGTPGAASFSARSRAGSHRGRH